MNPFPLRWISCLSLLYGLASAIAAPVASAEVPLTRADAESLYNRVEVRSADGTSRQVRMTERFSSGETFHTQQAARLDLRFNDGSLARIGEHTTFHFLAGSRTLSLPQGTGLFLIPFAQGQSIIETPGVLTEAEGAALIVRYIPTADNAVVSGPSASEEPDGAIFSGRTVVMALTQNAEGSVEVGLINRRKIALSPGQMAVVDQNRLYLFEFDLALFCQTSSLISDTRQAATNELTPLQPVGEACQVSLQKLATQENNFAGEYFLNPDSLDPAAISDNAANWLVPTAAASNSTLGSNPRTPPTLPAEFLPSNDSSETTSGEPTLDTENLESDPTLTPADAGATDPGSLPPGLITPSVPLESPVDLPEMPETPQEPTELPVVEPPPQGSPPVSPEPPVSPDPPVVEPPPQVIPPESGVPPAVEPPPQAPPPVSPEPAPPVSPEPAP